jgi:7-cyano-7-deazaguanine synthase
MLDKNHALVVLSGGQDSTTCLFWAKQRFERVSAITFRYGQKHAQEVDIAHEMAAIANVPIREVDAGFIPQLCSGCSLTDSAIEMDREKPAEAPPNTFVPGRNLFFLSMAAVHAREIDAMHLVTGVSQTDFSGYPDCRDSFIRSLNVSLNLGMDEQFVIHTPLMWLDKTATWAMADRLGVFSLVRERTLTCYNGIPGDGCGHCPACKLRRHGLETYLNERENLKACH